jgi:chitinase
VTKVTNASLTGIRALALLTLISALACTDAARSIIAPTDGPSESRRFKGVPSAPKSVTATAGDASATVAWQAPSNTGSSAITTYRVTASPGGANRTTAAATTTLKFTGLTNGTTYTFTVVATNRSGDSPASAPSNAVTPTSSMPAPPPAPAPGPSTGRWVSGYYAGYQRSLYPETSVDFSLMTHIIVAAVEPTGTGGVDTTFYVGTTSGPAMARTLASRAHQAGRKAILMLGGDGYLSSLKSATSNTNRAAFVANLLTTLDRLGYDGIDVDWEPLYDSDKPQLLQFLKDLRAARPGLVLTFPIGWVSANGGADAWYAQVAPLVDQMNVMSYGMADNWGGWVSWHSAALYGEAGNHPSSVANTARAYVAAGLPAAKLGIGIGAFGSCWQGVNAMLVPLDNTSARVTASDNTMSYATIMSQYYNASAYKWDATAQMGYLSFSAPTGPAQCTMVSYEDAQSVAAKGRYVKSAGLGGAMVWTINQGHIPNAAAGQQDPLLSAAYNNVVP